MKRISLLFTSVCKSSCRIEEKVSQLRDEQELMMLEVESRL